MTRLASVLLLSMLLTAESARAGGPVWMQVEETVVPIRDTTLRNAAIRGFVRKGQVLAVEKVGQNWIKVRVNDSLRGWVPAASVKASGPPVEWDPDFVKTGLAVAVSAAILAFLYLGLSLHLKRKAESQERSRQSLADAKRRLQNKIQLLFRGEPCIPSHLMMDEVDLREFLRNIGYVANPEKDPDHFLISCKAFKPNLILAGAEFRTQVEGLVETDALLINTPVIYMHCEAIPRAPENRIRAYLDPNATDKELGEAIALCLKRSPGKIRYSVKPVALKGAIQSGTLVELLHFLYDVKKSGRLIVVSASVRGEIGLRKGEIITAGMKDHTGARATEEILNLASGSFEFHEKGHPLGGPSGINTQKLLLDWARNKDEGDHHSRS